jgi:hypothetical protein
VVEVTVTRGTALRDTMNVAEVVVEIVNTEATVTVMAETGTGVEAGWGEVGATTDVVIVTSTVEVEETVMMEDILPDMMATDAVTTEAHATMNMQRLVQVAELLVVRMDHHVAIDVDGEGKAKMEWELQREGPQLLKVLHLFPSGNARLQAGTFMHLVTSSTLLSRPNKPVRPF